MMKHIQRPALPFICASVWIATGLAMSACGVNPTTGPAAVPVEIVQRDGRYQLLRGGERYEIKGAGLEFGNMAALSAHGANSIRTWRTDNGRMTGQEVLDAAAELGLTVSMCIEIGRERLGFDYDDEAAVAAQLEYARNEVLKYRDHPALLTWIIGNEVNLSYQNPRFLDAINDISKMIHELDPHHPTTTTFAGFSADLARLAEERAPDLDFISIQMYGDIVNLPAKLKAIGFERPYFVTEWGSVGHWEVGKTAWGAPIEQDSTQKAASYLRAWNEAISVDTRYMVGSYVFYWGQKQERTPTWYGMFLADGSGTEAIDVMQYIWTGNWPANRAPQVADMRMNGLSAADSVVLAPAVEVGASIRASDPEGDVLDYRWEIMRESEAKQEGGDREEIPETLWVFTDAAGSGEATFRTPGEPGAYRLFVYVHDGQGHAGHANIPFLVE